METSLSLKRTVAADKDFQSLVSLLDHELWVELEEDQATYDQYNKVPDLTTVVLVYHHEDAVACGCFKEFDEQTIEIKRMFVKKQWRGKGLSKLVLNELEQWAIEKGFQFAVLETSIHFFAARNLYVSTGYSVTPNYPPYVGLEESICMKKSLV